MPVYAGLSLHYRLAHGYSLNLKKLCFKKQGHPGECQGALKKKPLSGQPLLQDRNMRRQWLAAPQSN